MSRKTNELVQAEQPTSDAGNGSGYFQLIKNPARTQAILQANSLGGANSEIGYLDLIKISMPTGGSTKFVWDDLDGEKSAEEIIGVLVGIKAQATLWRSKEPNEEKPILQSYDMQTARLVADEDDDFGRVDKAELMALRRDDGTWDYTTLPWSQWGSAGDGTRGKAVNESRVLFLLRESDLYPIALQVSAASIKHVKKFVRQLSLRGVPHYQAIVAVSAVRAKNDAGIPYSEAAFKLVGTLSDDDADLMRMTYTVGIDQMWTQLAQGK